MSRHGSSHNAFLGRIVGGYRFKKLIGVGTYAEVYEVKKTDRDERLAMKVITKKQNMNTELIFKELEAMECLKHPNIISATDVFETDTHIYVAMPFCDGGDLLDDLNKRGSFHENKFREIFRQLVDALSYSHTNGWIHRDIKPENILLTSNGDTLLTDWGFACKWKADGYIDRSYGSLLYSAPEIILGEKYKGPEVDVWSLGCVLYTCVAGTLPFSLDRAFDSEDILRRNIITANYNENINFSPELNDLISLMLDIDGTTRISLDEVKEHPWLQAGYCLSCNGGSRCSPRNNNFLDSISQEASF